MVRHYYGHKAAQHFNLQRGLEFLCNCLTDVFPLIFSYFLQVFLIFFAKQQHLLITSNSNKNFTIFWAQQTIFPPKWKKKTNVNRFLGFFKASIFDFYNHFFLKIYFFLSFFKKNFFKFKRAVFYFLETGFQFFQNANGFQAFYILHAAFKINGGANVTSIAFYFNFLIHMFS